MVGPIELFIFPASALQLVQQRKEGNVLFNDILNTFYLRLYGVKGVTKAVVCTILSVRWCT